MAKVNLWLRGARGKFAGSSLSKGANGETIAREVVTPTNPNTDKQLYQRMIMATVMAAYGAGKEIFDHSFQGKSKGSACQQYFMERNLMSLRSDIAADIQKINAGTITESKCSAIVVAPKSHNPVPGRFLVSEGSYTQSFFQLNETLEHTGLCLCVPEATGPTDTIAQYAQRTGLVPGDIYTLVAFSAEIEALPVGGGIAPDGSESYDQWDYQTPCAFQFWRLQVKDDVLTNTAVVPAANDGAFMKAFFNLTAFNSLPDDSQYRLNNPLDMEISFIGAIGANADMLQYDFNVGSYAVIRSRFDQDLRSTTRMTTYIKDTDSGELFTGISAGSALRQWKHHVQNIGTSDLVLEGGN